MATGTRDRILDALERLLLDGGLPQITLEAVASAAGVSKGGLLYHFPSKEALLAGMVRRMADRADRQLASSGVSTSEWYLQMPDASDDIDLYQSLIAVMRSVDGQEGAVKDAVADAMGAFDEALREEIADPVQAEIVRLVGDGVFLAALLGLREPDPALYRKVVDRLLRSAQG